MPDPYAPKGWPRGTSERQSTLDGVQVRLRQLGATDDEIAAVVDGWDQLDPDGTPDGWTRVRREQVTHMGDNELRALLVDGRQEYEYATTTEEEAAEKVRANARRRTQAEAAERVNGTVPSVLAWVGDDKDRAQAVLDVENTGARRITLVKALLEILEA